MSLIFLPNTSLAACVVDKNNIYTYAQLYNGALIEIKGKLTGNPDAYHVTGDQTVIDITKCTGEAAAKRFTPLAAVYFDSQRFLFYVDENNYLRDVHTSGNDEWAQGDIYKKSWKCAAYSKLAAIKLTSDNYEFICVYFQDKTETGNIRLVNHSPSYDWQEGNPPLDDPPLYGTSISAVPAEPGIEVVRSGQDTDIDDPVIFFQYDKLELASSQDQGLDDYATYTINDKHVALSARAAIAALDDGNNFWCFYTTDTNQVYRLRVDKTGAVTQPQMVPLHGTPVPSSPLAAVSINDSGTTKIVLFYLLRHDHVNVFATTLTAKTSPPADSWDVSGRVCLAPAPTYAITGIKAGVTKTTVPLRLEVDAWYPGQTSEHLIQNNLFLHALRALQQREVANKLSFFQIAGIHGMPYQPWDEDTDAATPDEGYCTHDSLLFPCWHRPYMLLYEQVLYEIIIREVIPKLPKDDQKKWADAAATWRLPYWDWAQKKTREGKSSPIYDVPLITKDPRIAVVDLKDATTKVYIDNPMYKFTMPHNKRMGLYGISDIQDMDSNQKTLTIPFSKSVGTSRWAQYEPESDAVSTQWIDGTVKNSKVTSALNDHPWYGKLKDTDKVPLDEMVYRLYVQDYISSFTQFATTKYRTSSEYDADDPASFLSLEYIHNNVHNWTGGFDKYIGHMTEVPVAGFDPIFYMHHANIDRQFALWQAINQKDERKNWFQYTNEQLQDDGTWSIKADSTDTPSTPLAPFHKDTKGTFFTSDDVRDWMKWGYSYPELQPWLEKYKKDGTFNVDLYITDVRKQIKALYSLKEDSTPKQVEGSASTEATTKASSVGTRRDVPKGLGFEMWTKDVIVNVTYDRFAFNGVPYTLYLFIGDRNHPVNDADPLHEHPQYVGFVYTFSNPVLPQQTSRGCRGCRRKAAEGTRSRAQVPITGALVARLQASHRQGPEGGDHSLGIPLLPSLGLEAVGQYLEENLYWRVRLHSGQDHHIPNDHPFVEVSVHHRDARFDDVSHPSQYQRLERATHNKPGGYRSPPGH